MDVGKASVSFGIHYNTYMVAIYLCLSDMDLASDLKSAIFFRSAQFGGMAEHFIDDVQWIIEKHFPEQYNKLLVDAREA